MFLVLISKQVGLLFLFSPTLSTQRSYCFLTNIYLRRKTFNGKLAFWEISIKSDIRPLSYILCFVSDRNFRDKPSGVRLELYWGPRRVFSQFTQTLLPYSTVAMLQEDCQDVKASPSAPRANWWSDMGLLDSAVSRRHTVWSRGSWHTHCWFLCLATS